jgi:hypothetical protein
MIWARAGAASADPAQRVRVSSIKAKTVHVITLTFTRIAASHSARGWPNCRREVDKAKALATQGFRAIGTITR